MFCCVMHIFKCELSVQKFLGPLYRKCKPSLPVSVSVHERELEADESVQIRVIVPGRFVQEKNVPVSRYKHQTGKAIKKAEHDTNSACKNTQVDDQSCVFFCVHICQNDTMGSGNKNIITFLHSG